MNRVKHLLFRHVWVFVCALLTGAGVYALFGIAATHPQRASAASIVINSPAEGQKFEGTNLRVSGTTTANSTVLLLSNNRVVKQIISDGSGNWSADLTNLSSGENTITARVIQSSGYAYFTSSNEDVSVTKINQLRLSDNAINPNSGWPITTSVARIAFLPSPSTSAFFGLNVEGLVPAKFDAASPADPVPIQGYSDNTGANLGAFSQDGSKYYSPDSNSTTVTVVDVASNAVSTQIELGVGPSTVAVGANGKMYVATVAASKIFIIDPTNNTITKQVTSSCASPASVIASKDANYPYYFLACWETGVLEKYDATTDAAVGSFTLNGPSNGGILSLDNTKIYIYESMFVQNAANTDKIRVVSTQDGSLLETIQLTAGVVGLFSTPDFQKLYIATPSMALNVHNIDVYDVVQKTMTHLTTDDLAIAITAPGTNAVVTNVSISVVLGAKTTTLANTGVTAVSATLLLGVIFGSSSYIYYDYRRHKKPLLQADPNVRYTLIHHVKVVTIPLLKYRVSFAYSRSSASDNGQIHKF